MDEAPLQGPRVRAAKDSIVPVQRDRPDFLLPCAIPSGPIICYFGEFRHGVESLGRMKILFQYHPIPDELGSPVPGRSGGGAFGIRESTEAKKGDFPIALRRQSVMF